MIRIFSVLLATLSISAQAKDLVDPELIYSSLSNSLPGTVEHSGGLSTEIWLSEIICSYNNSGTVCTAIRASDGLKFVANGDVNALVLALINGGLDTDRTSEPGTTYVLAKNLNCFRGECKSVNPKDCINVPVEYSCSAD
jgi:hypothetical protein